MKTVSLSEYARQKGVSYQAIQALIRKGVVKKEADGKIDPEKSDRTIANNRSPSHSSKMKIEGMSDGPEPHGFMVEKIRLTKLQADKMDLELKKSRGELIEKNIFIKDIEKIIMAFRSRMLSRSVKIAPVLFGCESLVELKTELEKSDWECLNELSNIDPVTIINSSDLDEETSAPSKTDNQSVGRSKKKIKSRGKRRTGHMEHGTG